MLYFLVDLCRKLTHLNLELQGKDQKLIDMLSSIKNSQTYLVLLKKYLNTRDFRYFPHMAMFIDENPKFLQYDLQIFEIDIGNIEKDLK